MAPPNERVRAGEAVDAVDGGALPAEAFATLDDPPPPRPRALQANPSVAHASPPADASVAHASTAADASVAHASRPAEGEAEAAAALAADVDDETIRRSGVAKNVYERLRGLTLLAQYRLAQHGELHERIALERMYRNAVWGPLLRNPRISPPEVARLARMGNLPREQLEQICSNATWLKVPEVRRALLANPRLSADAIPRVLRQLSAHELKLVPAQTAYPLAVREAARRLLRSGDRF